MLSLPTALSDLIHHLARLPGVGPRSAQRLALALLKWEGMEVEALGKALLEATARVTDCPVCGCLSQDSRECGVCKDLSRKDNIICVVEDSLDALAVERSGGFHGRYHALGGLLSPVKGVLPSDLRVPELCSRVKQSGVEEVVVAMDASPEGEATALYLKQELEPLGVKMTRLARGLPSGGQLDYTDEATLSSALEHRTEM